MYYSAVVNCANRRRSDSLSGHARSTEAWDASCARKRFVATTPRCGVEQWIQCLVNLIQT